jgi:hypothetical protein
MARFLHLGRDSENKVVSIRSYILRTVQFIWCYCGLCIQFLETSCIIYLFSVLLWVYYTSLERGRAITRWATLFYNIGSALQWCNPGKHYFLNTLEVWEMYKGIRKGRIYRSN